MRWCRRMIHWSTYCHIAYATKFRSDVKMKWIQQSDPVDSTICVISRVELNEVGKNEDLYRRRRCYAANIKIYIYSLPFNWDSFDINSIVQWHQWYVIRLCISHFMPADDQHVWCRLKLQTNYLIVIFGVLAKLQKFHCKLLWNIQNAKIACKADCGAFYCRTFHCRLDYFAFENINSNGFQLHLLYCGGCGCSGRSGIDRSGFTNDVGVGVYTSSIYIVAICLQRLHLYIWCNQLFIAYSQQSSRQLL